VVFVKKVRIVMTDNFKKYSKAQKLPLQWSGILRAMAAEMSSVSDSSDLRDFFFRIGERFATDADEMLKNVETLDDLAEKLNSFWADRSWGWVELNEDDDGIDITHQCAPLANAFGDEELDWSVGFLEGFYQKLFNEFGASEDMAMSCVEKSPDGMNIRLRFALN
jgi:predicted hydrocarbon binding protein